MLVIGYEDDEFWQATLKDGKRLIATYSIEGYTAEVRLTLKQPMSYNAVRRALELARNSAMNAANSFYED